MPEKPQQNYLPDSLRRQYALEKGEAERLIARFGGNKPELDRLLGAVGRTSTHRRREMGTSEELVAYGLR